MSRTTLVLALTAFALSGCRSLAGTASGTCRVQYGSRSPAPTIEGGERVDRVSVRIVEPDRDHVTMRMDGCELRAASTPPEPNRNPHYLITAGSRCQWDVPSIGPQRFVVANRGAEPDVTESTGHEAYVNFADREIFLVFEAPVEQGHVRFSCDLVRDE